MKGPLALALLFSILNSPTHAYDFPNVTYRSCYDGDTCRMDIPGLHPLVGNNIPIRFARAGRHRGDRIGQVARPVVQGTAN